jgi:hypothetical protein
LRGQAGFGPSCLARPRRLRVAAVTRPQAPVGAFFGVWLGWGATQDLGFGSVNGQAHLWRPEPGLRSQKQTSGPAVMVRANHKRDTPVAPEPIPRSRAQQPIRGRKPFAFGYGVTGAGSGGQSRPASKSSSDPPYPTTEPHSNHPAHRRPGPGLRSQTRTVRPRQAARPKTSLPAQPHASASSPHNRTRTPRARTTGRVLLAPAPPGASASSPHHRTHTPRARPNQLTPDPAASSNTARPRARATARSPRTRTRSARRPCPQRPIHGDVRGLARC